MNKVDSLIVDSKKLYKILHQFTRLIGEANYLRKSILDSIVLEEKEFKKKKRI